jgi:hypothetical protein
VLDLTTLTGHELSSASKGVPDVLDGVTVADVPTRKLNLLKQEFPAPVAVLRQSAIRANIDLMRQYTRSAGVELAPHGKTTMAPQLFDIATRGWRVGHDLRHGGSLETVSALRGAAHRDGESTARRGFRSVRRTATGRGSRL